MNILKKATLLVLVGFGIIYSCTSDPIVVEIPGGPIEVDPQDTLILIQEGDLCGTGEISFQREVFPLLVSGCGYSGCHDNKTHEEGIRITSYSNIMKEIKPYDPWDSEIFEAITENPNDEDFMPPKPAIAFTSDQIQLIKDWINDGAKNTDCNIPCNSEKNSFAEDVFPIIETNCLGCHQPTNSLGNINLIDYNHIRTVAITGQLMGSIKHITGYIPMPETSLKLTDCQIATIQNWITEGAQNN